MWRYGGMEGLVVNRFLESARFETKYKVNNPDRSIQVSPRRKPPKETAADFFMVEWNSGRSQLSVSRGPIFFEWPDDFVRI